MDFLLAALRAGIDLLVSMDAEVAHAVWTSLFTSGIAVVLAAAIGIPFGTLLGLKRFAGRRLVLTLLNTLMALPTVVVGLLIYGLLNRQGPLGAWGFLFTPMAMIIG